MREGENVDDAPGWASSGYVIMARLIGAKPLSISRAEYEDLVHRADDLYAIMEIEESYGVLISNYLSLEKSHTDTLVGFMVSAPQARLDYEWRRREADRHLVNLLASSEMYSEHLKRALKQRQRAAKARGRSLLDSVVSAVESTTDEQREKFLGFRALKAMRNHVLHTSLPIEGWRHGNSWVPHEGQEVMRSTFVVRLRPANVGEKKRRDMNIFEELMARANGNGCVEWLPLVREYVEGVSYVHGAFRDRIVQLEFDCLSRIDMATKKYWAGKNMDGESHDMLSVGKIGPSGILTDERAINFDYQEQIRDLRRVNQAPIINLHLRQILV